MQKKLRMSVVLSLCLMMVVFVFSGCGNNSKDNNGAKVEDEALTHEELVEKAKEEGTVVVYSITSRISKAAESFEAKYGIKVEATNLKDFELIEKVSKESSTGITGADFVICQDSGRVFGELLKPGYLYNYLPPTMKEFIPEQLQEPLVFSMNNKVFYYNSETFDANPVSNIWQLTEPEYKEKFFFKNPLLEGVNANFLTMLTSDEASKNIEEAYEEYYGKKIELTTPNAGYEWIKRVFENDLIMVTSDTKMAEAIGIKGKGIDAVGLGTYSKLRYVETKNLALKGILDMKPFAGFYYPTYALMAKNAKNPYAAKLFIEYLLTEEGFEPWSKDIGTYSSNINFVPKEGDHPIEYWDNILIYEEPEFLFNKRAEVEEFLNKFIY